MLSKLLSADGLLYVGLKAGRDFAMAFAALVSVDGFAVSPDSMKGALIAAAGTTAFRVVRYVYDRFFSN
jgi:hypothetical protein